MENLCAELQVDLARLTILAQRACEEGTVNNVLLSLGAAALKRAWRHIDEVGVSTKWVYPDLLRALADVLEPGEETPGKLPLAEIFRHDNVAEESIPMGLQRFGQISDRLRTTALKLDEKNALENIITLVRHLRMAIPSGARLNDYIYQAVAEMLTDDTATRTKIQQDFNRWAEATQRRQYPGWGALRLWRELTSNYCPDLKRLSPMVEDWLERGETRLLVPFIVDDTVGVVLPVRVEVGVNSGAENDGRGEDNLAFRNFDDEADAEEPQIERTFRQAVMAGRKRAIEMLDIWNLAPAEPDFPVTVWLPCLKTIKKKGKKWKVCPLPYAQGSVELPVALALFCLLSESTLRLNPRVMATGPVQAHFFEAKCRALPDAGGVSRLLAIANTPNFETSPSCVALGPEDHRKILDTYYQREPRHWSDFLQSNSNVIRFGTDQQWDFPLRITRPDEGRASRPQPLIRMVRHVEGLKVAFTQSRAVQLNGLPGIGKTWIAAQWLADAKDKYKRVLYTSVPSKEEIGPWTGRAIGELIRGLDKIKGTTQSEEIKSDPALLHQERILVESVQNTLRGEPVLLVVDDAQYLANEDDELSEPRFRALIQSVLNGEWPGCHLMLICNRRLINPNIHNYPIQDGFSQEEALDFLQQSGWQYSQKNDKVVRVLANHPRALGLLVGYVKETQLSEIEIDYLMKALEEGDDLEGVGAADLRTAIGDALLSRILALLQSKHPEAYNVLQALAVFTRAFDIQQATDVLQASPERPTMRRPFFALDILTRRGLTYYVDQQWQMHELVSTYVQETMKQNAPETFKAYHIAAGQTYFPLMKGGRRISDKKMDDETRLKYENGDFCATALYHYMTADYKEGKDSIQTDYHRDIVAEAAAAIETPFRKNNPSHGYSRAEKLLDRVVHVYAETGQDAASGAKNAPSEINRLMGVAIYRQQIPEKREKARLHFHLAWEKGETEMLAEYVCLLCDLSAANPTPDRTHPDWEKALRLFNEIKEHLAQPAENNYRKYERLGDAYAKISRRLHSLGESETALGYLQEASIFHWAEIFLTGSEIARDQKDKQAENKWLERGLAVAPRDGKLWSRFYFLKALGGQEETIPPELRRIPRGSLTNRKLARMLIQHGLDNAAEIILKDTLEVYVNDDQLYTILGELYLKTYRTSELINLYERGLSHCPNLAVPLGRQYELSNPALAERVYRKSIKVNPLYGAVYLALSELLRGMERYNEALAVLEEGRKTQDAAVYLALSELLREMKRPDEALAVLEEGKRNAPKAGLMYLALSELLLGMKRPDEALAVLEEGKKTQDAAVYLALSELLREMKRPDEALAVLEEGKRNAPKAGLMYLALSELLLGMKRPDEALAVLEEGKKTHHGAVYLALSKLLRGMERYNEALAVLEEGRKNAPQDIQIYTALIAHYESAGYAEKAETVARDAFTRFPSTFEYLFDILHFSIQRGAMREGAIMLEKVALARKTDYFKDTVQLFHLEAEGRKAEAAAGYYEVVASNPRHSFATWRLAEVLITQEQQDEACNLITGYIANGIGLNGALQRTAQALGMDISEIWDEPEMNVMEGDITNHEEDDIESK